MTLETLKSAYPELITPELEELASSTFKRSVELEPILKTQYRYISPADRLAQWREISQLYDAAVQNTLTYAQEEQIRRLLSLESSAPILPGLKSLIRDKMMREVHWPLYQTLRLTQQWLALYTEHLLPSNLP
jgi:hypothetical protein